MGLIVYHNNLPKCCVDSVLKEGLRPAEELGVAGASRCAVDRGLDFFLPPNASITRRTSIYAHPSPLPPYQDRVTVAINVEDMNVVVCDEDVINRAMDELFAASEKDNVNPSDYLELLFRAVGRVYWGRSMSLSDFLRQYVQRGHSGSFELREETVNDRVAGKKPLTIGKPEFLIGGPINPKYLTIT